MDMMTHKNDENDVETDGAKTTKKSIMKGKYYKCAKTGHPAFRCKSNCYCMKCKSNGHSEGARYCKKGGNRRHAQRKEWTGRQTDRNSGEETEEEENSRRIFYEEHNSNETKDKKDEEESGEINHQTERNNNSTPFIGICFEAGGKEFNVQCIADTGSSKSIMSSKISDSYSLNLDTSRKIKLFNANGKMMTPLM